MTEQTLEQQLFQKRVDEYIAEAIALQEKHGIVPLAVLEHNIFGIVPEIKYFDKERLEAQLGKKPSGPQVASIKE